MKEALKSCTNISLTDFVANVDKEMRHIFPNILNYFHLENLSLNTFGFYIYNMLLMNIQKQICQYLMPSLKAAQMNLRYLIQTISATYLQDHLCFPWPSEARAKSSTPSPAPTSNMSKHVKFHFCGIFFIGGYQLGEWVCWNVEGRVKMSPSLISWRRTPPHHSCHPFHMALIRLTSTTPHSQGIHHSPVDLNIHTSFHCEWVHKYNQLFGPVSVFVEIKFQLDLSPGSKCSR